MPSRTLLQQSAPLMGILRHWLLAGVVLAFSVTYAHAATLSISASPLSVSTGASSTLTWSSTEATSCAASGVWSGVKAKSGSQSVIAPNGLSTYALNCSGPGGSASNTVVIGAGATPPALYALNVTVSGSGTVTSNPSGIACGATCSASYPSGAAVTLSATPATGYTFSGWSGACAGTNLVCNIAMSSVLAVTATFSTPNPVLFQDGFESGDLSHTQNNIRWWQGGARTSISTARALSGIRSLEFSFEAAADGQDSFSEHRIELNPGVGYTELWIRYDLYVPANYTHRTQSDSANNKFFALFRDPYTSPGFQVNFSTEPNGSGGSNIDVRYFNNGAGQGSRSSASAQNFLTSADAGRWHNIIMHFKVPTGQNTNDGVMQLWKNGSEIINITDLASWGGSGMNYFDQAYVLGWSNSGYAQQTSFYVDNFVISSNSLR